MIKELNGAELNLLITSVQNEIKRIKDYIVDIKNKLNKDKTSLRESEIIRLKSKHNFKEQEIKASVELFKNLEISHKKEIEKYKKVLKKIGG